MKTSLLRGAVLGLASPVSGFNPGLLLGLGVTVLVLTVVAFTAGYRLASRDMHRIQAAELASTQWRAQERIDAAEQRAAEYYHAALSWGLKVAEALEARKARKEVVYRTLVERVPYVVPQDSGNWYSAGFVGVWNAALSGEDPVPGAAGESAQAAAAARAAGAPSATSDDAILRNHIENARRFAECRDQLNALIDWWEGRPDAGAIH